MVPSVPKGPKINGPAAPKVRASRQFEMYARNSLHARIFYNKCCGCFDECAARKLVCDGNLLNYAARVDKEPGEAARYRHERGKIERVAPAEPRGDEGGCHGRCGAAQTAESSHDSRD